MTLSRLLPLALLSLVACTPSDSVNAPTPEVEPIAEAPAEPVGPRVDTGIYRWNGRGFCATLTVGNATSFVTDLGCDGSIDNRASDVRLRDDVLTVDRATMQIETADESGFSGTWTLGRKSQPAKFSRIEG